MSTGNTVNEINYKTSDRSPKVSIIIPVYNIASYLKKCLDSVANQTLKDLEIICIDDGSTDNSLNILKEYAAKDARFIIRSQKNEGTWKARNAGIALATGEYIFFLDSDDYLDLTALEKLYKKSIDLNLDICVCRTIGLDDATKEHVNLDFSIEKKYLPTQKVFSSRDVGNTLFHLFVGWPWDKLYKKELIVNNKIEFPALKNSEDTAFVFSALILSNKISIIEDHLYTHRLKTSNTVSTTRESEPFAFIEAMDILKRFLNDRNLFDIYKNGFMNYFISFSLWHLKTISNSKKESLYKKVREYVFSNIKNNNCIFLNKSIEKIYKCYLNSIDYKTFSKKYKNNNTFLQNIFSLKNHTDNGIKYKSVTILGITFLIKPKQKRNNK